jgi:hypothetical protein
MLISFVNGRLYGCIERSIYAAEQRSQEASFMSNKLSLTAVMCNP